MQLPSLPSIDGFSFWLGFGFATLIAVVLFIYRRQITFLRDTAQARFKTLREALTSGAERNFRRDTLRVAQTAHLAGGFFALNELLLPPRLLIPEPDPDPTLEPAEDDLSFVIPNLPDWPELAALYHAPTLSVDDAFKTDDHIIVLGSPGSGKSTLLAHLASRAATEEETGLFKGVTPLFIHAADIELTPTTKDNLAQPLIAAAQARAALVIAPQLPTHLRRRLREFKCVIFMDGLDELPPARITEVAEWLGQFLKAYPQHRFIAASNAWGHGPLLGLGFAPIRIAPWNTADYQTLIAKWMTAWEAYQARTKKKNPADVETYIIRGWLLNGNAGRSIFEMTLKIWGAFAGDTRGNRPTDWLEMYLQRAGLTPSGQRALHKMAVQMLANENLGIARAELAPMLDPLFVGPDGKPQLDTDDYLDALLEKRLLINRPGGRLSFRYSLTTAYCAALALVADPATLIPGTNPGWVRALMFFAALGDLTPHVGRLITQGADLLQSDLLTIARWLRDAPTNARWRGEVYKRLTQMMVNPNFPESLRLRALSALVSAHDPALINFFKQAVAHQDPFLRRMAVLGLGSYSDPAVVPPIAAALGDAYLDVRWAATLALTMNNSEKALDTLATGLATGDDALRQACAQALARNPTEGHALLKEALVVENDLGMRRAAVFGLRDIGTDWVYTLLDERQKVETEWFVRSAITEVMENRKQGPDANQLPRPYQLPEAQGWLVSWAAKHGTGVPPGKAAVEVLNKALADNDVRTRQAAAEAIGRLSDPTAARALYDVLRDPDALMRDAAFRALAHVSTSCGQRLAAAN